MFGINYIKFDSMTYVIEYKKGKMVNEGKGLSFFYFAPQTSIVAIPTASSDANFIFKETTADYQEVSIQGVITYKIETPKQLADLLDFTVKDNGIYKTDDYEKLNERIINEVQTITASFVRKLGVKNAIAGADELEKLIEKELQKAETIISLGIKPLGVNVMAIKPTPEMSRALEAAARENLQKGADGAIYERRNFAVEQERKIKQRELNTEIAIEEKKKEITEKHIKVDKDSGHTIEQLHFGKWLQLWFETIDELYVGDLAIKAKESAIKMATGQFLTMWNNRPKENKSASI